MQERPTGFPTTQPDRSPLKPITEVLLERRATSSFSDEPVPEEYLNTILKFGSQAPSGYNLQPWRFIVLRDRESRQRLQGVAFGQAKIGEAPVVIIAVGMKNEWKDRADEVFRESAKRGWGRAENVESSTQGAIQFISTIDQAKWVTRHSMIALTTMMLVAEAYGFDTAPMEGFDADGVKREFGIPDEGEVVALLAIGRARAPEKPYAGRFELSRTVYAEKYGEPWKD